MNKHPLELGAGLTGFKPGIDSSGTTILLKSGKLADKLKPRQEHVADEGFYPT